MITTEFYCKTIIQSLSTTRCTKRGTPIRHGNSTFSVRPSVCPSQPRALSIQLYNISSDCLYSIVFSYTNFAATFRRGRFHEQCCIRLLRSQHSYNVRVSACVQIGLSELLQFSCLLDADGTCSFITPLKLWSRGVMTPNRTLTVLLRLKSIITE